MAGSIATFGLQSSSTATWKGQYCKFFLKLLFVLAISKVAAQVAMATQFFKDPTQDQFSTFSSLNHFTYHFGFTKALLANDAILQGQCYMMNIEVEVYVCKFQWFLHAPILFIYHQSAYFNQDQQGTLTVHSFFLFCI